MQPRPLARPPIAEALVDLRVVNNPLVDAKLLEPIERELAARYPKFEKPHRLEGTLKFEGRGVTTDTKDLGFIGIVGKSSEGNRTAQFRKDGFTLNQLPPYPGGDALLTEAMVLWALYRNVVNPDAVVRIALRYIDRLELPYRSGDPFSRFLTAAPEMPQGAPQQLVSFLTRVVAEDSEIPAVAIVTQTLEAKPEPAPVDVVLDIDVFRQGDFQTDENSLRAELERLRELKNRIFFSLLTDAALELYL
jgi:uncharacterized protein (TIGR04255 family)